MEQTFFDWDNEPERFSVVGKIHEYLNNTGAEYNEALANIAAEALRKGLVRQLMEDREEASPGKLRISNSGPCSRKCSYAYLAAPQAGKKIDARARLTFLTGDLLEIVVVSLIKLAGISTAGTCLDAEGQEDLWLDAGEGLLVPGHSDGRLLAQVGLAEEHLLEIKSTSAWSFDNKFAKGIIDTGYKLQHQGYLEASNLDKGLFVAINKNTGHLAEIWTERDPDIIAWAKNNHLTASKSSLENLPDRYHDGEAYGLRVEKKTGELTHTVAPLCSYCAYFETCLGPVETAFKYGKPVITVADIPEDIKKQHEAKVSTK